MIGFRNWSALLLLLLLATFTACEDDLLTEFPDTNVGELVEVENVPLATYNIHGGKGPNGEGDFNSNLTAFKGLLQNEMVICMQEVEPDCWASLKAIFPEYQHRFYLSQHSTKFGTNKSGGNAILSKLPILEFDSKLIQTDPGGDKWERKAQYVKLFVGGNGEFLHLFHYHNTYNWHNDNSASEKAGFSAFMQWVRERDLPDGQPVVVLGDFNLIRQDCESILLTDELVYRQSSWVDHIFSEAGFIQFGIYQTNSLGLSDHNAVWADFCNGDC